MWSDNSHIILNVQDHLKVISPILTFMTVIWKNRIVEEYL